MSHIFICMYIQNSRHQHSRHYDKVYAEIWYSENFNYSQYDLLKNSLRQKEKKNFNTFKSMYYTPTTHVLVFQHYFHIIFLESFHVLLRNPKSLSHQSHCHRSKTSEKKVLL
ncbi:CLUMA_CG005821, isoform A [Clunio marinus]|uniref:CLUMA_CG005821, isoform A n=1 Tax=Clunio marinus TaxID=568069 RepID=A0A1J1HW13_9DIPT|nr:CLUMA_CG005821, isoform A [Clunio marinus]